MITFDPRLGYLIENVSSSDTTRFGEITNAYMIEECHVM